ncbi:MAG: hypothetical protein SXQ77_07570 [Halobacteria archaeon]|nr:hypothetical protein [Halobacteria archaeon]
MTAENPEERTHIPVSRLRDELERLEADIDFQWSDEFKPGATEALSELRRRLDIE